MKFFERFPEFDPGSQVTVARREGGAYTLKCDLAELVGSHLDINAPPQGRLLYLLLAATIPRTDLAANEDEKVT